MQTRLLLCLICICYRVYACSVAPDARFTAECAAPSLCVRALSRACYGCLQHLRAFKNILLSLFNSFLCRAHAFVPSTHRDKLRPRYLDVCVVARGASCLKTPPRVSRGCYNNSFIRLLMPCCSIGRCCPRTDSARRCGGRRLAGRA